MSDSDSAIIKDKPIRGFTKRTGLYGVSAPWLKPKGALGRAIGEINDGQNTDGNRKRRGSRPDS
jgi:hypothetical protein